MDVKGRLGICTLSCSPADPDTKAILGTTDLENQETRIIEKSLSTYQILISENYKIYGRTGDRKEMALEY